MVRRLPKKKNSNRERRDKSVNATQSNDEIQNNVRFAKDAFHFVVWKGPLFVLKTWFYDNPLAIIRFLYEFRLHTLTRILTYLFITFYNLAKVLVITGTVFSLSIGLPAWGYVVSSQLSATQSWIKFHDFLWFITLVVWVMFWFVIIFTRTQEWWQNLGTKK